MKSVSIGSLILAGLGVTFLTAALPAQTPTVKLVDMYAKAVGDQFKIHIVANGDISQYKTTRKLGTDSYKLTLDVPALPPLEQKYDLETPFSQGFEVWPMMLNNVVYSRITITLDLQASSVVGLETPSRIFVTISRKSAKAVAEADEDQPEDEPVLPDVAETTPAPETAETPPLPEPDTASVPDRAPSLPPLYDEPPAPPAAESVPSTDETGGPGVGPEQQEFFSLFPTPVEGSRPIFDVPFIRASAEESLDGLRVGGFLMRPVVYASWLRGTNVLLLSDQEYEDSVVLLRFRTVFDYLGTDNVLRLVYEIRFKDYRNFNLDDHFSHFFDFNTAWDLTPRMKLRLNDHFVRGNTESTEFDPGREIAFNSEPFYRNLAGGALQMDFSERMGVELSGSYNVVRFVEEPLHFYDYNVTTTGGSFLYHLSPLTTLFGKFQRQVTPEPLARSQAASTADALLLGIRGELSPLMTGTVQAGYQRQEFGSEGERLFYRGFVADVHIVRYFSEQSNLSIDAGRANHPSNFEDNGYYTSNFIDVQLVTPVARKLRLTMHGSFIDNNYPLSAAQTDDRRADNNFNAGFGLAYFFSRHGFFQLDFLHERRRSNLESYRYRNNVLQFLVGWGFLSQ